MIANDCRPATATPEPINVTPTSNLLDKSTISTAISCCSSRGRPYRPGALSSLLERRVSVNPNGSIIIDRPGIWPPCRALHLRKGDLQHQETRAVSLHKSPRSSALGIPGLVKNSHSIQPSLACTSVASNMLMCDTQTVLHPPHLHPFKSAAESNAVSVYPRSMDDLLQEVQNLFERQLRVESLLSLSKKLQIELKERLDSSPHCMLPSHNYTLPDGEENGTYLALEVGGSTLRVATVDLTGRSTGPECLRVRRMECSPIDSQVRQLQGLSFFDWIAERIADMLVMDKEAYEHMLEVEPLHMGIAWAFPIELVPQYH